MRELLVVDDEANLLDALSIILSEEGYIVQTATSGEVALEILERQEDYLPALIVTDVIMPGITGMQLMETVRSHDKYAQIPFLFISATSTEEMESQMRRFKNAYFLRKPFQIDQLCNTIKTLIDGR